MHARTPPPPRRYGWGNNTLQRVPSPSEPRADLPYDMRRARSQPTPFDPATAASAPGDSDREHLRLTWNAWSGKARKLLDQVRCVRAWCLSRILPHLDALTGTALGFPASSGCTFALSLVAVPPAAAACPELAHREPLLAALAHGATTRPRARCLPHRRLAPRGPVWPSRERRGPRAQARDRGPRGVPQNYTPRSPGASRRAERVPEERAS